LANTAGSDKVERFFRDTVYHVSPRRGFCHSDTSDCRPKPRSRDQVYAEKRSKIIGRSNERTNERKTVFCGRRQKRLIIAQSSSERRFRRCPTRQLCRYPESILRTDSGLLHVDNRRRGQ